jgi:hypothetical protein
VTDTLHPCGDDVVDESYAVRVTSRSTREQAMFDVLRRELDRVGRTNVSIQLEGPRTVTLVDKDGSWHGPVPSAFGALVTCSSGGGAGSAFWAMLGPSRT